jgi:hypothetical protein
VSTAIEELVQRLAARDAPRTEAEVQADLRSLLLTAPLNLVDPQVRLEAPAGSLRIDVEVGRTVIEVKKDLRIGHVAVEALTQLAGYVASREASLGVRYVGVLTDGVEYRAHLLEVDGALIEVSRHTVSFADPDVDGLLVWLEGVLATSEAVPPIPENIRNRFGATTSGHQLDRGSLAALYAARKDDPHVKLKRELWARLLRTAFGTQFHDDDELFIEHTYLVIVADLIAHAVVGFQIGDPAYSPQELVSGQLFSQSQIAGVVESDFFDWPTDVDTGCRFVRELARRIAQFDWSHVEHDILKVLYESVIDADQRHALGEYYTPDWLAAKMVAEAVTLPLEQRVLDPACGSGTFLFWAVRAYLDAADGEGRSLAATLDGLMTRVMRVDVHPVAVTLARVTYLLAIGSRIRNPDRPVFTVPVYLGDSLQWQRDESMLAGGGVTIPTRDDATLFGDELHFPAGVVGDAGQFDRLVAEMADKATDRQPGTKTSVTPVLNRYGVMSADQPILEETFATLCRLVDEGRDHIWGYYVRNLARPYWLSLPEQHVDVLVGNPPWLAYRYMPNPFQEMFRTRSQLRRLWAGGKVSPHQDLSGFFVARCIELYLRDGGRFAFVMPNAVLSRPQHEGFRTGRWGADPNPVVRVRFETPWDLHGVEPDIFPVPSAVVFGEHATEMTAAPMPTQTTTLTGTLPSPNCSRADAQRVLVVESGRSDVAGEARSAYADRFFQGATITPRVLVIVESAPAGPLGTGAGRRAVQSLRSNLEKEPWKSVVTQRGTIEAQFVRTLHLGATVGPFRTLDPILAVITWDGRSLLQGVALDAYPGLAAWWNKAEEIWEAKKREASSREGARTIDTLIDRLNFNDGLVRQFPTPPHRVVYTTSGTTIAAARVSDPGAIINSDLYGATVSSAAEAQFLCAILNSEYLLGLVARYQSRGAFGRRHFHKVVFQAAIPEYSDTNPDHVQLATLGARAETVAASVTLKTGGAFTTARKKIRAGLAGDGVAAEIERIVTALVT